MRSMPPMPIPGNSRRAPYEREKYDATLAALPLRVGSAFEIGCSIGVLTRRLSERCDRLLAVDVADARRLPKRGGAARISRT